MYKSLIPGFVASTLGLASATSVAGQPLCRPQLTVSDVHLSEMIGPTMERRWTAKVAVDATGCQTDTTGYFDIVFTRLSETAPDLEFRERFAWQSPLVEIAVSFAANEAVQRFRFESVTPCVCTR